MSELTAAMKASLGYLRLHASAPLRFLDSEGNPVGTREVKPPGALVGRDETADVLLPESESYVSRRHLLIEPHGLEWILIDIGSSHGTRLRKPGQAAWGLPAHVPFPIGVGDCLFLAQGPGITIERVVQQRNGLTTKNAPPPGAGGDFLDPKLAEFVLEMWRAGRERPGSVAVPSAEILAEHFDVKPKTIYNWRDKLLAMDPVARNLSARRETPTLAEVADAAAAAFPYLKRPSQK